MVEMKLFAIFLLLIIMFSFSVLAQESSETYEQQISALRAELQNQLREKQNLQNDLDSIKTQKSGNIEILFISGFINIILIILVVIAFLPKRKPKAVKAAKNSQSSQLKDYISELLDKGYAFNEIKQFLIKSGWPESAIEKAYNE